MSSFDERENAFETKFAHDEEMLFKAVSRRNRMVGMWAAELLGKNDPESYAREVMQSDFEEAGHDVVVRKLTADLGALANEETVRAKMDEMLSMAKMQLAKEG
ncbi:MAG: DUF1476 domain-containing protein [Pseudomonadota bacterium]